jgi:hypothetical protein
VPLESKPAEAGIHKTERSYIMKKTHKVSFVAKVPTETTVRFKTRDGEKVKFDAVKPVPTRVTFKAKNKPQK